VLITTDIDAIDDGSIGIRRQLDTRQPDERRDDSQHESGQQSSSQAAEAALATPASPLRPDRFHQRGRAPNFDGDYAKIENQRADGARSAPMTEMAAWSGATTAIRAWAPHAVGVTGPARVRRVRC
jgi:hypothetical protein